MTDKGALLAIVRRFPEKRLLVLGDLMIDRYIWGGVDRISPEAPVPVVHVEKEEMRPGGAANVALNVAALGAAVEIAGIIGEDEAGLALKNALAGHGISSDSLVSEKNRPTTLKTRVIAQNQQIVRYDHETQSAIQRSSQKEMIDRIRQKISTFDGIIVSDYAKGVISKSLMTEIRTMSKKAGIPVAVDPKIRNIAAYRGVHLITPNHHEAGDILHIKLPNEDTAVEQAGRKIVRKLNLQCLIVTRASKGMSIFRPDLPPVHIPTVARQVFDVTGAGDSVISAMTLARVSEADWEDAARIANHVAGIVVAKVGTAVTSGKELKEAIKRFT